MLVFCCQWDTVFFKHSKILKKEINDTIVVQFFLFKGGRGFDMGLLVSRPIPSSKQQVNVIDEELRRLFEALDANRDGLLSNDELVALFKENGQPFVSSQSVGSLMARYTLKKEFPPDMWTFEEFCKVFKTALTLFHEIDSDANGFIDVDELEIALVLNNDMGPLDTNVSALIQRFDVSRDGRLDFAEFFFLYDMSAREKLADLLSFWYFFLL